MTSNPEQLYTPAARRALHVFGVEAVDLQFIRMAENVTFRVTDARDHSPLVLRLHRPWYHDIDALRSEHIWTRALVDAGIAAPEPLLTPSGESFVQVDIAESGEQRWAGLARWVEGEMLGDAIAREPNADANTDRIAQVGALMAALHNQAVGWTPPGNFQRHRLDAAGLMGAAPFWGPFWEQAILTQDEQEMLLDLRDRLHATLVRYGEPKDTFSLIHADLHPGNVVIGKSGAAVIDFDDTGFGWHLYDFAAALAGYQNHTGFAAYCDAFIAGYRMVRTISDRDLKLLPMFLLIREMAILGWYHQRPELPRTAELDMLKERVCKVAANFDPPI